jgi:hypothetical protein
MGPPSIRGPSTGMSLRSARLVHDVPRFANEEHVSQIRLDNAEHFTSPLKEAAKGEHGGHA